MKKSLFFCLLLSVSTVDAAPVKYTFFQGGYDEGASLWGQFTGDDLNGDGKLSSIDSNYHNTGEITDSFYMSFSGNSQVSAFEIDSNDDTSTFYLKYDLNHGQSSWIGDDSGEYIWFEKWVWDGCDPEGECPPYIGHNSSYGAGILEEDYQPIWTPGIVQFVPFRFDGYLASYTSELVQVNGSISNVPIPASVWLFLSGLIGLFGRKKNISKITA